MSCHITSRPQSTEASAPGQSGAPAAHHVARGMSPGSVAVTHPPLVLVGGAVLGHCGRSRPVTLNLAQVSDGECRSEVILTSQDSGWLEITKFLETMINVCHIALIICLM